MTTAVVLVSLIVGGTWLWGQRGSAGALTAAQGPSPAPSASVASPSPTTTPTRAASQPTLILGDSLALVVYPYLARMLPDRYVSYLAEVGRSTAHTYKALQAQTDIPPVVIVSSGTNDQMTADVATGAPAILDALGPTRCVVWVDVVRPDSYGDPATQVNAAIDAAVVGRSNVTVLRWSRMVAAHPDYLAHDGIHPTEAGTKARAEAFAAAAARCSPIDPSAPPAPRQTLPDAMFWGPLATPSPS